MSSIPRSPAPITSSRVHAATYLLVRSSLAHELRLARRQWFRMRFSDHAMRVGRWVLIILAVLAFAQAAYLSGESQLRSFFALLIGTACTVIAMLIHPDELDDSAEAADKLRQDIRELHRDALLLAAWRKGSGVPMLWHEGDRIVLGLKWTVTKDREAPIDYLVLRREQVTEKQWQRITAIWERDRENGPHEEPAGLQV